MAITTTIGTPTVTSTQAKLWTLRTHLKAMDGEDVLIDKDYSVRFRPGEKIADKGDELIKLMQKDIDEYKEEQEIFKKSELDTLVTNVKKGLKLNETKP